MLIKLLLHASVIYDNEKAFLTLANRLKAPMRLEQSQQRSIDFSIGLDSIIETAMKHKPDILSQVVEFCSQYSGFSSSYRTFNYVSDESQI